MTIDTLNGHLESRLDMRTLQVLPAVVRPQKLSMDEWQFWPASMAMGTLSDDVFYPTMSAMCRSGIDEGKGRRKQPLSFLAFDFQRQLLVMKSTFVIGDNKLPPALTPLDAELPFCDVSMRGIHISSAPLPLSHDGRARQKFTVTVSVRRPPRYYAPFELEIKTNGGNKPFRRRATALDFSLSNVKEGDAGVIQPIPEGPTADPTFWNTFQWQLFLTNEHATRFQLCVNKIQALATDDPTLKMLGNELQPRNKTVPPQLRWLPPNLSQLDFDTRALLEGLIGNGILRPIDALQLLQALSKNALSHAAQLRVLESLFVEEQIRNPTAIVRARVRSLSAPLNDRTEHLVMVRTVQVTPTRMLIGPPQPETSNAVTRRYADHIDAIVRVQFCDEGDKLQILDYTKRADKMYPQVGLMARVRRALQYGIEIAGKRYYPVASSSSQQKDHSMWFVDNTVIDMFGLLNWMGRVSETVVAKHAARLGLVFSASRFVDLDIACRRQPDVERNGHCFTDGCSIAGREVMAEAAKALNVTGLDANPSAIQFRLGGAKGVLSCWPDLVDDDEVILRPSQVKFESPLAELNVIRGAHYQVAFLNRQFIMIMSANGVPDSLFVETFQQAIRALKDMPARAARGKPSMEDLKCFKQYTEWPLEQIISAGLYTNPFVQDVVDLVKCRALQDIKWRGRVKLDGGVYLIGISDESSTLQEGELFCQYQRNENEAPVVITGEVLICRAPALHPGDVRRAQAVDYPNLRHLKNVIVFSTLGERPLPNMLGGGDLDGDDYTLIWDQRFVQPLREFEPMNYTAPPPKRVKQVTQADLNENFVQYILNDILGQVDNAHLANSDLYTPFDERCLRLSEIHSTAVDFAKTGLAAELDPDYVPKKWPDFMGKPESQSYPSQSILGHLFRLVDESPVFTPRDLLLDTDYQMQPKLRELPMYIPLLHAVRGIKAAYDYQLQYTMRRFKVEEAEAVAAIPAQNKKRKRSRELNHLHEPLRDTYEALAESVRTACETAAKKLAPVSSNYTPMEVAAWHAYVTTFNRKLVRDWEDNCIRALVGGADVDEELLEDLRVRPLTSFAWIFWQEIITVLRKV